MRKTLATLAAILLVGCNGGSSLVTAPGDSVIPAGEPGLGLAGSRQAGSWRVDLIVREAVDLYQIAASVSFPAEMYEVVLVESGGGLGGPLDSFFAGSATQPGRVDMAYTMRFEGRGADGDLRLASIKVVPSGDFNIRDFRIESAKDVLLVHDSQRQPIDLPLAGGGQ